MVLWCHLLFFKQLVFRFLYANWQVNNIIKNKNHRFFIWLIKWLFIILQDNTLEDEKLNQKISTACFNGSSKFSIESPVPLWHQRYGYNALEPHGRKRRSQLRCKPLQRQRNLWRRNRLQVPIRLQLALQWHPFAICWHRRNVESKKQGDKTDIRRI